MGIYICIALLIGVIIAALGWIGAILLRDVVFSMAKKPGEDFANAQIAERTVTGYISKLADNPFTTRYLLAKVGSDVDHIDVCTATDVPLGIVCDQTGVDGDTIIPLNVATLPAATGTQIVQASAAIALGALVVPAAGGQVRTLPAVAGTYTVVGRALCAGAAAGDQIEIAPTFYKVIVPTNYALTSSQNATAASTAQTGAYVQADVQSIGTLANALKINYNALQADVAAIKTALNTAGITT